MIDRYNIFETNQEKIDHEKLVTNVLKNSSRDAISAKSPNYTVNLDILSTGRKSELNKKKEGTDRCLFRDYHE